MDSQEQYDVIIIGGGISGLSSSALLQKSGLQTCLIEMDARPGGYIAGFDRKKFRFDSSIHWLNNCGPNGWVHKVFNIIGNDFPKAKEQKHIRRFLSEKFDYLVSNDPNQLKEQWIKEFPGDKKGILRFFRDAKRISKSFDNYINLSRSMDTMGLFAKISYGIKMLKFALPFIPHVKYAGDEGIEKGLTKYFSHPKLRAVFGAEPDLLSCLIPFSWAYSNNYQTPPSGGSQRYAEWLLYATKKMGAAVFFKSKVIKILLKDQKAIGIRLDNDKEIYGKYIISAIDAEYLYKNLLPKSLVHTKMIEKIGRAKMYDSGFTVSIGIDCNPKDLGFGEENIYLSDTGHFRNEYSGCDFRKSGIHVMASSTRDQTLAPIGKGTLTLFIPASIESFNYWGCKKDENGQYIRGEEYKRFKEENANLLIHRVQERMKVDLKSHIEYYDVATPITLLRYTGNKNGSMMGQRPGKENIKAKVASYHTPISNLLQSGHWADLGGGILVAMKSSVNTSLMLLQKENPTIFKLLAHYMDGKVNLEQLLGSDLLMSYDNSWIPTPTPAEKITKR